MSVRILLVDDHAIMLEGLKALIQQEPDMEVVAQASTGRDAVRQALRFLPDVVVIDVSMPDLNGIEATRKILADNPSAKVIALSIHADSRYVCGMLQAGAAAYLLKQCAYEDLSRAIRAVMDNQSFLSPHITQNLIQDYMRVVSHGRDSVFSSLSPREREVLQLLAEGSPTKNIATGLGLSIKTVETHRQNIMRKLGLGSTAELVKYAIREGITTV